MPREIGGCKIQRVLGSGGMATVYAALQKQPRRTVAIKVMRSAATSDRSLRRFRREIEFLGKLRHPFIAQVYDAGVYEEAGGSAPYFVMEYVPRAKTIVEFAEEKELSLRHRLKLFTKVCAAVEHGHHRKIIHRDLKPGNILIDEAGDPRVIDFGVARAMELDLTTQTMHTEEGRLVGTIQYMAPEQLEPTRQNLDARCDVYALGVVLYRLLTGRAPHDLAGLPVFTAAQVVREDAPMRPSSIKGELKGDLETIVLKALSKDPKRRYRNAGSLGRDILRFLTNKPIKARRAGLAYRARLFMRRHVVEVRAAVIIVAVMAIAGSIVVYQRSSLRAETETQLAATGEAKQQETPGVSGVGAGDSQDLPGGDSQADHRGPRGQRGLRGSVREFRLDTGGSEMVALAFDPTGSYLAGSAADQQLKVWDVSERQTILTASDHDMPAKHIAFDGAGDLLASVADDGRVVIVERATGRIVEAINHDYSPVHAMAFSAAGDVMALACGDMTIRVLHRGEEEAQELYTLRGTSGAFRCLAFDSAGGLLAAGTDAGAVYLWDAETAELISRYDDLREKTVGICFGDEDERLIGITESGAAMSWAIYEGEEADRAFAATIDDLVAIEFDATGRLAVCASKKSATILDLSTGKVIGTPLLPAWGRIFMSAAVSSDGRYCALSENGGRLRVIKIPEPPAPPESPPGGGAGR